MILILIAVVNPTRAHWALPSGPGRPGLVRQVQLGAAVVAGAGVVLALLGNTIVELFDVSNPSFRLGAGAVMLVAGIRMLAFGPSRWPEAGSERWTWLAPVAFPVLFTPELATASVSYSADEGWGWVVAGLLAGLGLTVAVHASNARPAVIQALGRLLGAVVVIAAVVAIVSGIRDI